MHEYTAGLFHEDRMRELTREADASRLAAIAKVGQPRRHPRALVLRWLSFGVSHVSVEAWRARLKTKAAAPILARRPR
jgi:hypothetical protein